MNKKYLFALAIAIIVLISVIFAGCSGPGLITQTYKVEFYDGDNLIYTNDNAATGANIVGYEPDAKAGYTFEGWYLDKEFTTKVEESYQLTQDISVYAHYAKIQIKTVDELVALANTNKVRFLGADIDASSIDSWTPIANFSGTLDGDGYKITGLKLNSNQDNLGLFSTLKGTVKNLELDVEITNSGAYNYIGAVCGTNEGTIKNVTVNGTINCATSNRVGGIAGLNKAGTISGCTNKAAVTGYERVGGVVGSVSAKDTNAFSGHKNTGEIHGLNYVGGIVGVYYVEVSSHNAHETTFTENENDADIIATGDFVGGLIGYHSSTNSYNTGEAFLVAKNCSNKGEHVSGKNNVGGFIGKGMHVKTINNVTNEAEVVASGNYAGGFAGYFATGKIEGLTNNVSVTAKAYAGGIAGFGYILDSCTNEGTISVTGTETIGSLNYGFLGGVAGSCFNAIKCTNNADISLASGLAVGGVAGCIKGKDGITTTENVNNGNITGTSYVGGIVGMADAELETMYDATYTFSNNKNTGEIFGSGERIGGLIGYQTSGTYTALNYTTYIKIIGCKNEGDVSGENYVGGMIGYATYAYDEATLWGTDTNTGTIIGAFNSGELYGTIYKVKS